MAFTVANKADLEKAIAQGAREIEYSDGSGGRHRLQLRTQADIAALLRRMETDINPAKRGGRHFHVFSHGKGLR